MAFESIRDQNWQIYVMDADGKNQVNLSSNDEMHSSPAWSRT
ncbi:MAG: hypothetical protein JW997_06835 [Actinobacteria bacterium]|nr:hypothetical protein [Actinomycetota bacterium]